MSEYYTDTSGRIHTPEGYVGRVTPSIGWSDIKKIQDLLNDLVELTAINTMAQVSSSGLNPKECKFYQAKINKIRKVEDYWEQNSD